MKILFALIFALTLCGSVPAAEEAILYWMIEDSGDYAFDFARLYAVGADNKPALLPGYNKSSGEIIDDFIALADGSRRRTEETAFGYLAASDDWTDRSFFVELLVDDGNVGTVTANSRRYSYKEVESAIGFGMSQDPHPISFAGFAAVPEPSSGLMALLGLAALALRRKRA